MARILVLDAYWHKSLAAIRCLGKFRHHVFAGETTRWNVGFFSRYVAKPFFVHASPQQETTLFLEQLAHFLKRHRIQVLLPMEESTLRILLQYQEQLPSVQLPFGPLERIDWIRDKKNPLEIAHQIGVPIPKTFAPVSLEEALAYLAKTTEPVLIKPRISTGAVGIVRAYNLSQKNESYQKVHRAYPLPLIQEILPAEGKGLGVSFLFTQGQPIARCSHLRLREPLHGGSSTLRISCSFPREEAYAEALLKACQWQEGVAMVEFKQDLKDGQFRLMEINPRYWGSLALAIEAGVPFPEISVRVALKQPVKKFVQKNGILVRWLLPGDLLLFWSHLKQRKWDSEFFLLFGQKVRYDICSWDDPLPVLGRILSLWPYYSSPEFASLRNRTKHV